MESALKFLAEKLKISKSDKILVAASGGRDSTALSHLLHTNGYSIALAHVNYRLRGVESDEDEKFVENLAQDLGVEFHVCRLDEHSLDQGSVQLNARKIRYDFFQKLTENHGYRYVATAHHQSDQVETFFINLLRGSGTSGLSGIPEHRGNIIRPLISTTNEEINHYISKYELEHRHDQSNDGDDYLRNRIRHHLIPEIEKLHENGVSGILKSIELVKSDADAIKDMANAFVQNQHHTHTIDLSKLPEMSTLTWLYHSLKPFGFSMDRCRDLFLSKQSGKLIENNHFKATRQGQIIVVTKESVDEIQLQIDKEGIFEQRNFCIAVKHVSLMKMALMPKTKQKVWLSLTHENFPITISPWQAGDKFKPLGCDYWVSVSDYLSDKKFNRFEKESTLKATTNTGEIIWLLGIEISEHVRISKATASCFEFELYSK